MIKIDSENDILELDGNGKVLMAEFICLAIELSKEFSKAGDKTKEEVLEVLFENSKILMEEENTNV